MKAQDIVVTNDAVGGAGAVVYWRLSGDVDPEELAAVWSELNIDWRLLPPEPPPPATALARAMREQTSRRALVRPLPSRAHGHALVRESTLDGDLSYQVDLRACIEGGAPVFDPPDHPLAEVVARDYKRAASVCSAHDIGGWLCSAIRHLDGVGLRSGGGVYYLPPESMPTWDAVVSALRRVSAHALFAVPAMSCASAAEAFLDALEQEAATSADEIRAELETGRLKARALRARVESCEAVISKLGRYEALFGQSMETMRQQIQELKGDVSLALLTVQEPEEQVA